MIIGTKILSIETKVPSYEMIPPLRYDGSSPKVVGLNLNFPRHECNYANEDSLG